MYKKRTGDKPEGCAIMFKRSRLSLVSSHPLEYLRPGDALLDRDNVGLVVLLRPADTAATGQPDPSDFFCVANTHLLYNPRRGDIKLAQLAILLAEISRLSRLPDGSSNPVVVCGDFNSVPWSPLYCFLTQGSLEFKGLPIGMVRPKHFFSLVAVLDGPCQFMCDPNYFMSLENYEFWLNNAIRCILHNW